MISTDIVSEITKYELILNGTLTKITTKYLPAITKNWWHHWYIQLTPIQRSNLEAKAAQDITGLDFGIIGLFK